MVRVLKDTLFVDGKHYIHAAGLSTDQKPTEGIVSGSFFAEINTGKEYLFDETGETWYEKPVRPIIGE